MQFIPPERGGMRLIQFFPELGPLPHPRENPTRTLTHPSFPVRLGATYPQWSGLGIQDVSVWSRIYYFPIFFKMGNGPSKSIIYMLKSLPISIKHFSITSVFVKYVKGGIRYFSLSLKFFDCHLDLHVTGKYGYVAPIVPDMNRNASTKLRYVGSY